jgi:hypothetical protein
MKGKKKTSSNNGDPRLTEISGKLDILIRLSSLGLVKDMKTQKEQIAALSDAGFQPKDIAGILRTSPGSVRVALHDIRKERASAEVEEEAKPEVKENAQES